MISNLISNSVYPGYFSIYSGLQGVGKFSSQYKGIRISAVKIYDIYFDIFYLRVLLGLCSTAVIALLQERHVNAWLVALCAGLPKRAAGETRLSVFSVLFIACSVK